MFPQSGPITRFSRERCIAVGQPPTSPPDQQPVTRTRHQLPVATLIGARLRTISGRYQGNAIQRFCVLAIQAKGRVPTSGSSHDETGPRSLIGSFVTQRLP
jgi:hypothetical protein